MFSGKSSMIPLLFGLVLNLLFAPILASRIQVDCDEYPDSPECEKRIRLSPNEQGECQYTVTMQSRLIPYELATYCARRRQTLPCLINKSGQSCEIDPMAVSDFELQQLLILNRELQARMHLLQKQDFTDLEGALETRSEAHQIFMDNLNWLCARKCNNSTCEFVAELKSQTKPMGVIPRLTSLITPYPKSRKSRLIEVYVPIRSDDFSHILHTNILLKHLSLSSLPLSVFCKKN